MYIHLNVCKQMTDITLLLLHSNTWNHLTLFKRMSSGSFKNASSKWVYISYIYHHHVVPLARISLTLSRHFPLLFIASGRSSGLHPVSSHSCCMYVWAGRPAFARPYVGVHRSTSHEFVSASPAVSCVSGSSSLDSFRDRRQVAV